MSLNGSRSIFLAELNELMILDLTLATSNFPPISPRSKESPFLRFHRWRFSFVRWNLLGNNTVVADEWPRDLDSPSQQSMPVTPSRCMQRDRLPVVLYKKRARQFATYSLFPIRQRTTVNTCSRCRRSHVGAVHGSNAKMDSHWRQVSPPGEKFPSKPPPPPRD